MNEIKENLDCRVNNVVSEQREINHFLQKQDMFGLKLIKAIAVGVLLFAFPATVLMTANAKMVKEHDEQIKQLVAQVNVAQANYSKLEAENREYKVSLAKLCKQW